MTKLLVRDSESGHVSPFLGGILVQSLVSVGLSFAEAYEVAQHIRGMIETAGGQIDGKRLRELVADTLEQRFGAQTRLAYVLGKAKRRQPKVRTGQREEAFSVGVLARRLEGCGIHYEESQHVARLVEETLSRRGDLVIERDALRRIVFDILQSTRPDVADRYVSRCRFRESNLPLILLIGGATGVGKSTTATRLAGLLDIVRIQSTDMMREIIRCYLMPHVVPTLAYSSFDAWRGLPGSDARDDRPIPDPLVVSGFLAQFGNVKVAIEATISRAVKEREHLIIEGVHVLPSQLNLEAISDKALVIPLILALTTRDRLEEHLTRRVSEQPDRDSAGQRRKLEEIWRLQSYMIDQAERAGIPVIAVRGAEETVSSVMFEVMRRVSARFPPSPSGLPGQLCSSTARPAGMHADLIRRST
ncbi:MAG: hypothetical protein EOM91_04300 [Sphingobacteriia bacterium]|nr:hypothetical protein [Sphingobacteriia bacterium]NCC39623.1 hypothetical protein [Gammaproteobacteria bacterium]